jgi:hypothetical protein
MKNDGFKDIMDSRGFVKEGLKSLNFEHKLLV